jgi:hypothetical protein
MENQLMTTTAEAEAVQPAPSRSDRIVVAITEAIIASQEEERRRKHRYAWVDTNATLEALAEVAARIAFQTKIAVTAADGREFAKEHTDRIGLSLKALRKSRDKHPFAQLWGSGAYWTQMPGERAWMSEFPVAADPHERV